MLTVNRLARAGPLWFFLKKKKERKKLCFGTFVPVTALRLQAWLESLKMLVV